MRYRQLGRTGFAVSEISLGTVEIGMSYGIAVDGVPPVPDEVTAARLLNAALDSGVNLVDTARAYGESEAIIGRALSGRRQEFVLVSKVLSRRGGEFVLASVAESLRLLQTDFVDILMVHCAADETVPDEEVFDALSDLKRKGSVRSIGASVYGEAAALATIRHGGYDCLQVAYSVLDRRLESEAFPLAEVNDVGIVGRSVLLKGALTSRYRYLPETLSPLKNAVQGMETLAAQEPMTLPEMAYRYVLSQPIPQTALVGTASIEELQQAIKFAESGPLPETQIANIRAIPMPDAFHLNPGNWQ